MLALSQEREFLKLAAVVLNCRWCIMGNRISPLPKGHPGHSKDLAFHLLGYHDYYWECVLTIREWAKREM